MAVTKSGIAVFRIAWSVSYLKTGRGVLIYSVSLYVDVPCLVPFISS